MLALAACGGDSGTTPDAGDTPIAEESIGAAGGVLAGEGFTLTVPPGAFDGSADLALYHVADDSPFADQDIPGHFRIEGLPADYADTLHVSVELPAVLRDGASSVALGWDGWKPSPGINDRFWCNHSAEDVDDTREFVMPPPADGLESVGSLTIEAYAALAGSMVDHLSSGGHFLIGYASGIVPEQQVIDLADDLERARAHFLGMGFSMALRTDSVIQVTVRQLPVGRYGAFVASPWNVNSCALEFSQDHMHERQEIAATAGHEFLHLIQNLYDPRSTYDAGSDGGPQYWLDEATAVWSERGFLEDAEHVPSVRENNEFTPLLGIQAGVDVGHQPHGYGLSSLVHYLLDARVPAPLVTIYEGLVIGDTPPQALLQPHGPPAQWWLDYLTQLVDGGLYGDVTGLEAINAREALWSIGDDDDTEQVWTADYPDLSGKLYLVRLDHDEIAEGKNLKAIVSGWEPGVSAWKYIEDEPLVHLGSDPDSLVVSDLRGLTDEGAWILLLASSATATEPGYWGESPLTLTVRVENEPSLLDFDEAYVRLTYEANWLDGGVLPQQGLLIAAEEEFMGGMQGEAFIANWDYIDGDVRYVGSFSATFDPLTGDLLDWSAQNVWDYQDGGATMNHYQASGSGRIAATYETDAIRQYDLYAEAVCDQVQNITVWKRNFAGETTQQLLGFDCNANSDFRIRFKEND